MTFSHLVKSGFDVPFWRFTKHFANVVWSTDFLWSIAQFQGNFNFDCDNTFKKLVFELKPNFSIYLADKTVIKKLVLLENLQFPRTIISIINFYLSTNSIYFTIKQSTKHSRYNAVPSYLSHHNTSWIYNWIKLNKQHKQA